MLTTKQLETYRERGYITVPGVFSQARVQQLQQTTHRLTEASREETDNGPVYDLEPDHSATSPRLRRIKDPELQDPAYDAAWR